MDAAGPGTTIGAAHRWMRAVFRKAKLDTPDLDARVLVSGLLGVPASKLLAGSEELIGEGAVETLADAVRRRLVGEPVARILGRREFWGLDLALSPDTLVPRPDSETLVEAALEIVRARGTQCMLQFGDLGTGSGAIAIAIASEVASSFGIGVDVAAGALETAAANARRHGLAERLGFVRSSWCDALTNSALDLILANPPYIASGEIGDLAPEVARFEPRRALDGGPDGLDAYRALVPDCRRVLRPGGLLLLEVGETQAVQVGAILMAAGFRADGPARRDLAGHERVIVAHKAT